MEEATGRDWWQVLAAELKQHIWGYLGLEEIIMASAVCSDWRHILLADQHQPWATIFQRFLPPPILQVWPFGAHFSSVFMSDVWVVLLLGNVELDGWILGAAICVLKRKVG